jgi:peptidyl-prolyl cis-trans isomerase SurA
MVDKHRKLGTFEENYHDIYKWLAESGAYDEAKRRKANEYASRLGWTERDDDAVARLESSLDEVEPEFGNLAREYHDGLLVFEISNREIWERVSIHPEELESFYESHTKQFKFKKPCFRGMVLFCRSEEDFNNIKPVLDRTDMSEWVDSIVAYNTDNIKIRVMRGSNEIGLFHQGQNEYVDKIVFGKGEFTPMAGFPYVNVMGNVVKQPDSINDVAGEVAEAYQTYLEENWIKRLKSKYNYQINKKALKKVCKIK